MIRLFELLLLISFLPAMVVPFLPLAARPRWLRSAASLLPVLCLALHAAWFACARASQPTGQVSSVASAASAASAATVSAVSVSSLPAVRGLFAPVMPAVVVPPEATMPTVAAPGAAAASRTLGLRSASLHADLWRPTIERIEVNGWILHHFHPIILSYRYRNSKTRSDRS